MDAEKDPSASYKLLREEFSKRGYFTSEEYDGNKLMVTYAGPNGKIWKTSAEQISYPFSTKEVRQITINKGCAYGFVENLGYSIPFTRLVEKGEKIKKDEAIVLIKRFGKLIVKPLKASLARGLTLNITTFWQLKRAISKARKFNKSVLIQQQVEGEEIRFTVIDGKLVSALLRRTPRVIGDGHSTVAELIRAENIVRESLRFKHISYPQLTKKIVNKAYFKSKTVLKEGEVLELNRATMIKNGASVYDVRPKIHPDYIEAVEKIVAKLGAKFVAVDMFVQDYTKKMGKNNYYFIEFNTSPVLKLFFGCRDNVMFDVVPPLVDVIEKYI